MNGIVYNWAMFLLFVCVLLIGMATLGRLFRKPNPDTIKDGMIGGTAGGIASDYGSDGGGDGGGGGD